MNDIGVVNLAENVIAEVQSACSNAIATLQQSRDLFLRQNLHRRQNLVPRIANEQPPSLQPAFEPTRSAGSAQSLWARRNAPSLISAEQDEFEDRVAARIAEKAANMFFSSISSRTCAIVFRSCTLNVDLITRRCSTGEPTPEATPSYALHQALSPSPFEDAFEEQQRQQTFLEMQRKRFLRRIQGVPSPSTRRRVANPRILSTPYQRYSAQFAEASSQRRTPRDVLTSHADTISSIRSRSHFPERYDAGLLGMSPSGIATPATHDRSAISVDDLDSSTRRQERWKAFDEHLSDPSAQPSINLNSGNRPRKVTGAPPMGSMNVLTPAAKPQAPSQVHFPRARDYVRAFVP